ncbi:hypothetical protein BH10PLA2_BH10PLA2_15240 [soil metagenome]
MVEKSTKMLEIEPRIQKRRHSWEMTSDDEHTVLGNHKTCGDRNRLKKATVGLIVFAKCEKM